MDDEMGNAEMRSAIQPSSALVLVQGFALHVFSLVWLARRFPLLATRRVFARLAVW